MAPGQVGLEERLHAGDDRRFRHGGRAWREAKRHPAHAAPLQGRFQLRKAYVRPVLLSRRFRAMLYGAFGWDRTTDQRLIKTLLYR